MLDLIETRFLDAIKTAIDGIALVSKDHKDIVIGKGPSAIPDKQLPNYISVFGMNITPAPVPDDAELTRVRAPAYALTSQTLQANGTIKDFKLSDAPSSTELAEVEWPVGCAVRLGEDYYVEEKPSTTDGQVSRTLRFYVAPTKDTKVVATIRGDLHVGYVERRKCEIKLVIGAWGSLKSASVTPVEVDVLGREVLAASLSVTNNMPNFEATMSDSTRQRLIKPWAVLSSVDRFREIVGNAPFIFNRVNFTFTIRGEIELTYRGSKAPDPTRIKEIDGQITRNGVKGDTRTRKVDEFVCKK